MVKYKGAALSIQFDSNELFKGFELNQLYTYFLFGLCL